MFFYKFRSDRMLITGSITCEKGFTLAHTRDNLFKSFKKAKGVSFSQKEFNSTSVKIHNGKRAILNITMRG